MPKLQKTLAALSLLSLLGLPTLSRADGFLDAAKSAAGELGKTAGNKAITAVKGSVGKAAVGKLEAEANTRLLAEARKNQCSFKSDSAELEPGCDQKSKKLASVIIDAKKKLVSAGLSGFKFEVSGHTDTRGDAAHNKDLSERRAKVMVKQLIAQGVPEAEIIAVGFGAEKPLVKPDNTLEKQAKNRRYELRVRL